MSTTFLQSRSLKTPLFPAPLIFVIGVAVVSCGDEPPDSNSDPPPSFNLKYVLELSGNIYYPYTGSGVKGEWLVDYYGGGYTPYGSVRVFGPVTMGFGTWYTVADGRWPAIWKFTQVSGGCIGQSVNGYVVSKNSTLACLPVQAPGGGGIVPVNYPGGNPPPVISLFVNPSEIPDGSPMTAWIVREDGYIGLYHETSVGTNGQTDLPAPVLYDGAYTVLGNFTTAPNGYEYVSASLDIYGNPGPAQPTSLSVSPNEISQGQCFGLTAVDGENMLVDMQYSTPGNSTETIYGLQMDSNGYAEICTDSGTEVGVYEFFAVRNALNDPWVPVSDYIEVWPGL